MEQFVNRLLAGDAKQVLAAFPAASVDMIVTSPPYWGAVSYDHETPETVGSYDQYIEGLSAVWRECARVLRPNGKLAINSPLMPVPKKIIGDQHTRHLKNINNDIEFSILKNTDLARYSFFIWQKQTSKLMFGSYPYPGNILENNTIEFINVLVKPGRPPKFSDRVKKANLLSQEEWVDLTQQIWFMYPEDVKREGDHPAPFPEKLPGRLIRMYSHGAVGDFPGEIVLDPFCGLGTACAVAKRMGRRYIGIDISRHYLAIAERRLAGVGTNDPPLLFVGRPKYPGKEEREAYEFAPATGNAGPEAILKHKRATYGRGISRKAQTGFNFGFEEGESESS